MQGINQSQWLPHIGSLGFRWLINAIQDQLGFCNPRQLCWLSQWQERFINQSDISACGRAHQIPCWALKRSSHSHQTENNDKDWTICSFEGLIKTEPILSGDIVHNLNFLLEMNLTHCGNYPQYIKPQTSTFHPRTSVKINPIPPQGSHYLVLIHPIP